MFQHAIELDPNFAAAYTALGTTYGNIGKRNLAIENQTKAFVLRERASEQERFLIEARYYYLVEGDIVKAQQTLEVWKQTYPKEWRARNLSGGAWVRLGQFDKSLEEYLEALRLNPEWPPIYGVVVGAYRRLNRFEEAYGVAEQAKKKNLDSFNLHLELYLLAFVRNDSMGMAEQVSWSVGTPRDQARMNFFEAQTAAYSGHLREAHQLSTQAVQLANQSGDTEMAANFEVMAAVRDFLLGNATQGRNGDMAASKNSKDRDIQYGVALALAMKGDVTQANSSLSEIEQNSC